MIFTAHLRRMSLLWQEWRRDVRVGGFINGVQFRWKNGFYCTEELSNDDVAVLMASPFVIVEASGLVPELETVVAKPVEAKPVEAKPAEPVVTKPAEPASTPPPPKPVPKPVDKGK